MISVIATIHVRDGHLAAFMDRLKANVPHVLNEPGCIEYQPAIDLPTDLPSQACDAQVVTIIEKWRCLNDLNTHMAAPHMLAYREAVKPYVDKVSLKILQPA